MIEKFKFNYVHFDLVRPNYRGSLQRRSYTPILGSMSLMRLLDPVLQMM